MNWDLRLMIITPVILRRILKFTACLVLFWTCAENEDTPRIIPRNVWNARNPVYPRRMENRRRHNTPFTGICIHYSGFSSDMSPRSLQDYQILHLGYPDINYHYIIDTKGRIFQGRDTVFFCETRNKTDPYIHLCCISDMKFPSGSWVPDKQKNSLRKLIQYLYNLYNIHDKDIFFYDSTGYEDLDFM
ncbi:MAG: Putative peptidoglycan recognition protein (Probable wrong end) [Marinimicrobia bacterium 46_47]|nr:MAG: Putative peptidoglycan recognition protein (Probable wrong end) [Marinimicrobia bacterium 46_47]KUK93337.1 MAG: Putative peptidoglycan recognition protein (Probable wrong end) [Marinimicrobia bacterium 46_43]